MGFYSFTCLVKPATLLPGAKGAFLQVRFKNKGLREICEKQAVATKKMGPIGARKLRTRLADIQAAERVTDLEAGSPHPLKGDRFGQFALDLAGGWRLVFAPANEPIPRKEDASIDWFHVTVVSIEFIGDYHD